jgi:hypothetical protein
MSSNQEMSEKNTVNLEEVENVKPSSSPNDGEEAEFSLSIDKLLAMLVSIP